MSKPKDKPPAQAVKALITRHDSYPGRHRAEDRTTPLTDRGKPTASRLRTPRWLGDSE
jgi:hypothetical protein